MWPCIHRLFLLVVLMLQVARDTDKWLQIYGSGNVTEPQLLARMAAHVAQHVRSARSTAEALQSRQGWGEVLQHTTWRV